MRLIDGDELLTAFPYDKETPVRTTASIRATIKHMPTLSAAPAIHAHWISDKPYTGCHCSNCGEDIEYPRDDEHPEKIYKYCFHCGARMDEEEGKE